MILSFHPCFGADRQIIVGDRTMDSKDLDLIHRANIILLPQNCSAELYRRCRESSASLFPNYDSRFLYPGKIGQYRLFRKLRRRHPETIPWRSVESFRKALRERCGLPHPTPYLLKRNKGHEGQDIALIRGASDLTVALDRLSALEISGEQGFVSQDLVSSGGNVLRAVVMDQKIFSYWKRPVQPGQIITTISRGARIERHWRRDLMEKGEEEAKGFACKAGIDLAAIDLVFSLEETAPRPFFLEINYYFGRRGLGGSENYYRLLFETMKKWIRDRGFDPGPLRM